MLQLENSSVAPRRSGAPHSSNIAYGHINTTANGKVTGWLYSPTREVTPVLKVDGRPARLTAWPTPREDVKKTLGIGTDTGFSFTIDGAPEGAIVELYALSGKQLHKVFEKNLDSPVPETSVFRQLERIQKISQRTDAVAITSWDGAHNPIGRAKVLYDVANTKRPAAIVTYLFPEFGGKIWQPLSGSDFPMLTIPWDDRERYHRILTEMGVKFPTVWICKPRLPNFMLAEQIAAKDAKLILDLDDNEDYFSKSLPSRTKIYGAAGLQQSKHFQNRIVAKTVASVSLREAFGGEIVRHARYVQEVSTQGSPSRGTAPTRIGFIGTVRPHKNILAAAKSISMLNWRYKYNVQLHVYGDVQPASLKAELQDLGVVVKGIVPADQLQAELSAMNVILTGFPSQHEHDELVTQYQITSKIGDALAAQRPVLTPRGPSVSDLEDIPGVFLFDEFDFAQRVGEAITFSGDIDLPYEYTFAGAYEGFLKAESLADNAPRAKEVLRASPRWQKASHDILTRPTLLLLWKQHDAGIYGRRIDQIARSYKRLYPSHNVRVLELWHEKDEETYSKRAINHLSDTGNLLAMSERKLDGGYTDADGVVYEMLKFRSSAVLNDKLFHYLSDRSILPGNTVMVLFPFIRFYDVIQDLLDPYVRIVDVVDNQFSWKNTQPERSRQISLQYNTIFSNSAAIVFNSEVNSAYFSTVGFLPLEANVRTVPNWYTPPLETTEVPTEAPSEEDFGMIYSGNMSDRIDWEAINAISEIGPDVQVHLVGAAERADAAFFQVLESPNVIYHGAQTEQYSLALLRSCKLAVMPHLSDDVSNFMNPLKLHMYMAAGVSIVSSQVQGIDPEIRSLAIASSKQEFVQFVRDRYADWKNETGIHRAGAGHVVEQHGRDYLAMIDSVAPWKNGSASA